MKKSFRVSSILCVCLFVSTVAMAGNLPSKKWMVGAEVDLVPYLYDGYYLSGVAGYGKLRARFIRTNITTPGFATESGFKDNELNVNAYIIDYYFKENFSGWWVSPGYEVWKGKVKEKSSGVKRSYRTDMFTFGGGYTFRLNEHVYINPWVGVHIPVGGDTELEFVNSTFKVRATPEASIKVGVNF
ncbi:hypothetical protein [Desulfoluna limicola]|nr:hypothetical protein [Desulfoluna limicola]